jgi:hypothetical protein
MFDILTSQNRYAILHRLDSAKRAETRARRLEKFVAMLALGQTIYPQTRELDNNQPVAGGGAEGARAEGGRAEDGRAEGGRAEGGRAEDGRANG